MVKLESFSRLWRAEQESMLISSERAARMKTRIYTGFRPWKRNLIVKTNFFVIWRIFQWKLHFFVDFHVTRKNLLQFSLCNERKSKCTFLKLSKYKFLKASGPESASLLLESIFFVIWRISQRKFSQKPEEIKMHIFKAIRSWNF